MTIMTKLAPPLRVDCERDRFKRPVMLSPGTGMPTTYQRVTTLASMIDDTYNLTLWKLRKVAQGIAWRDDLRIAASTTDDSDKDGKAALDVLCERAMDAAQANKGSAMGTAFHRVCQIMQAYPDIEPASYCPAELLPELAAYRALVAEHHLVMPVEYQERCGMCPEVGAAGTWDDLVLGGPSCGCGRPHVADKKSGQREFEYGQGKVAAQLSIYSRFAALWKAVGGGYEPVPEICPEVGYVISVPIGRPDDAVIYPVDLVAGWERALLAVQVRDARSAKRGLFGPALTLPGARMANDDATFDESTGQGLPPAKPKRTRRTKAQIAADAAAAEAALRAAGNHRAADEAAVVHADAILAGAHDDETVTVTKAADVAGFLAGTHDEVPSNLGGIVTTEADSLGVPDAPELSTSTHARLDAIADDQRRRLSTGTAHLMNGELKPGPAEPGEASEATEQFVTDAATDATEVIEHEAAVELLETKLGATRLDREREAAYAGLANGTSAYDELAARERQALTEAIMQANGKAQIETAYGLWSAHWTPEHDQMAVRRLISLTGTRGGMTRIWETYQSVWTDDLTAAGEARLAELTKAGYPI